MRRPLSLLVATLLLVPASAAGQEADHAGADHVFVRITSSSLMPSMQTMQHDQAIGWLNYSNRIAKVSFDREVGKKLLCKAPGFGSPATWSSPATSRSTGSPRCASWHPANTSTGWSSVRGSASAGPWRR